MQHSRGRKMMTNAEKFKEVFGFWPDVRFSERMCNSVCCFDQKCDECQHQKANGEKKTWEDEYAAV